MHFVFLYPQLKNLTGAQRLILELAGAIAATPGDRHRVTLLTHTVSPACRAAIPAGVGLCEGGFNLNRTPNHYLNSLLEYFSTPFLLKQLSQLERESGEKISALCFFDRQVYRDCGGVSICAA